VLVMISIPSLGILFLQNTKAQTYLAQLVASKLSENLHAKISIGDVSLTFINRIVIKNLYIEDLNGDTLLFSEKTKVTISSYSKSHNKLTISRIGIEDARINFVVDSTGVLNLKFILDALKSEEKSDSTSKMLMEVNKVELKDSRFHYSNLTKPVNTTGLNFADMEMRDLNLNLSDIRLYGDTTALTISDLRFTEKSGISIKELNAEISFSRSHLNFNNVNLLTQNSSVSAEHLKLSFFDFSDFSDFDVTCATEVTISIFRECWPQ